MGDDAIWLNSNVPDRSIDYDLNFGKEAVGLSFTVINSIGKEKSCWYTDSVVAME